MTFLYYLLWLCLVIGFVRLLTYVHFGIDFPLWKDAKSKFIVIRPA